MPERHAEAPGGAGRAVRFAPPVRTRTRTRSRGEKPEPASRTGLASSTAQLRSGGASRSRPPTINASAASNAPAARNLQTRVAAVMTEC